MARLVTLCICILVSAGGVVFYLAHNPLQFVPFIQFGDTVAFKPAIEQDHEASPTSTLLFVGDMMLGRDVELTLDRFGGGYVHQYMYELYDMHTYQVANFESAVPRTHVPTPMMGLQFSTKQTHASSAVDAGFTHFSLANNHAFDHGSSGFTDTYDALTSLGVHVFGKPYTLATTSITHIFLPEKTIALIGIDTTLTRYADAELTQLVQRAAETSDMQIVYIHWGVEYAPRHSNEQERLARVLVAAGTDLIVGHHPHVVQDIALVDGVLVFYSLGNFIFDQYFNDEVQTGLTLSYDVSASTISLIPVSTLGSAMAPRIMPLRERSSFLRALSKKSDSQVQEAIISGTISLE